VNRGLPEFRVRKGIEKALIFGAKIKREQRKSDVNKVVRNPLNLLNQQ